MTERTMGPPVGDQERLAAALADAEQALAQATAARDAAQEVYTAAVAELVQAEGVSWGPSPSATPRSSAEDEAARQAAADARAAFEEADRALGAALVQHTLAGQRVTELLMAQAQAEQAEAQAAMAPSPTPADGGRLAAIRARLGLA